MGIVWSTLFICTLFPPILYLSLVIDSQGKKLNEIIFLLRCIGILIIIAGIICMTCYFAIESFTNLSLINGIGFLALGIYVTTRHSEKLA